MKAYAHIIKMEALANIEYRFNLLIGPFSIILSISVNCLLWHLIMKSNNLTSINGMSFYDFAFYFSFTFMIHQLRSNWAVCFEAIEDIRRGLVTRFLTRPLSLFWNYFAIWIGRNVGFFLMYAVMILCLKIIYSENIFQAPWQFPVFLFSILISIVLSHCMYMNLIILNFWFNDVSGLIIGFNFFSTFAFGTLIPYSFYPPWALSIVRHSPLPYVVALPTQIAQGTIDFQEGLLQCLYGMGWLLLLGLLFKIVYSRAIRVYGAYGG